MKVNSKFRSFSLSLIWIWIIVFAIVPNLALVMISFLDRGLEAGNYFIPVLTLQNYIDLFIKTEFFNIFTRTFGLSLASTLVCLVIGYPFAYLLARSGNRYRHWLLMLLMIPFWTNSLIRTYAVSTILRLISSFLIDNGFVSEPSFTLLYTNLAVFIGMTYTLLPFMILPLYASIEKLDVRLLDAARDLGATPAYAFVKITLPLTMPGIVAGSILVFLPALGCFYVQEVLGGNSTVYLGSYIRDLFVGGTPNWPRGAAASMVLTLLLFMLAFLYRATSRRASMEEPGRHGGFGGLKRRGGIAK